MRHYRCKCGKSECFGSESPHYCDKCSSCGSDLASGPTFHEEPKEHEFASTDVETDEGIKQLSRCIYCHRTKKQIAMDGD